jgi:Tfp pilus assembly protein PilO
MSEQHFTVTQKQLSMILTVLTIMSILASAVIAYAVTDATVAHNTQEIDTLKAKTEDINKEVSEIKTNVAVLNVVAEDVKEIKQDVKQLIRGTE